MSLYIAPFQKDVFLFDIVKSRERPHGVSVNVCLLNLITELWVIRSTADLFLSLMTNPLM